MDILKELVKPKKRRGGKRHRKHGRNKKKCERYKAQNTRMKNKLKKLDLHIKYHPNDSVACFARGVDG